MAREKPITAVGWDERAGCGGWHVNCSNQAGLLQGFTVMIAKASFEKIWDGLDTLLLVAVFLLLGIVGYSTVQKGAAREGVGAGWPVKKQVKRPVQSPAVEGMRVSAGRTRVNTIARSMVASEWEQVPPSLAMDMREDGKLYEVLFSLPEGVAKESVRVTAVGNVLTLTMKAEDTGKVYMQRVRIPCGVEKDDNIQSIVTNDVLRVRILPPVR